MNRLEFLTVLGAAACATCLGGCTPEDQIAAPPTNVDLTLDLSDPANSALVPVGGYQYNSGLIIAHTAATTFVAVSQTCTHAGGTVYYDKTNNDFHCPNHGSNFRTDGSVINGPASSPLMKYTVTLSGSALRITS